MEDVSLDDFRAKCKKHNLKVTPQRTVIYKELLKARDHPYADEVFARVKKILPNISFDTVNRTLLTFSKVGIADVVEGRGEPKRFDPNTDRHHHFWCIKCNKIIDFEDSSLDNLKISEELQKRFTVLNQKVVLEGICNKCKNKK